MARLHNFPTPLSSAGEQVYLSGLSRGYGAEDDASMVRMYYPDPISKVDTTSQSADINLIRRLLSSIHICAAAEAIAFAKHLNLDLDQFYGLANDAAGGSTMFREVGAEMIKGLSGTWEDSRLQISNSARVLSLAVDEARKVNCPVPLASETLNLLLLAQRRGWGTSTVASVVRMWEEAT
jgi:3-hydroxyisobutyrate dehydrogenase